MSDQQSHPSDGHQAASAAAPSTAPVVGLPATAESPPGGALSDAAQAIRARAEQAVKNRKPKAKSMITQVIAPGHKRKALDVLVANEKKRVRRAVLTEDDKRRNFPNKYPDSAEREEDLVKRLLNKYPHVSEATMRTEIVKVRSEPKVVTKVLKLKKQLKTVQEALRIAKSECEVLRNRQNDAAKVNQRLLQEMKDEHAKLKKAHLENVERKRALEEKLKLTQDDLEKAKRDGSDLTELLREKDNLKMQLWAVQNESSAHQKEWTRVVAQTLREKENTEAAVKRLKTQLEDTDEEKKRIINEQLADSAKKDQMLRAQEAQLKAQAAAIEAMKAEFEEVRRAEYVKSVGPRIEDKMKAHCGRAAQRSP